jgi:FkbM family methyltransferase
MQTIVAYVENKPGVLNRVASLTRRLAINIDSLKLPRIDFIKIDVEGMEMEALIGAAESVAQSKPALLIESIKTNPAALISLS